MSLKENIKNEFGEQIFIEYIDVQEADRLLRFPQIMSLLATTSLSNLPVIAINGDPVWFGSITFSQLVTEIGKRGKAS
jgi:hypothetical protein